MSTSDIDKDRQIEQLQGEVSKLQDELDFVRNKGKLLAQEVDLFRQRRVVYWSDRFRNAFDAWNLMNPGFQQLKDDSSIFNGSLKDYRLQPSFSLLRVPFLTYKVRLNRANLRAILLAPIVDVPLTSGEICMRVHGGADNFHATSTVPMSSVKDDGPAIFEIPTLATSDKDELVIRVFVQGVDAPVRIFELRRYAFGGFGRLSTKPFAGYLFD